MTTAPAKSPLAPPGDRRRRQRPERDPLGLVEPAELLHRAVQVDRAVVAGVAQHPDHALRLAERIGADQVRALRETAASEASSLAISASGRRMAEDRQAEGRLGDEDVAGHRHERQAGRVGRGACSRPRRRCAARRASTAICAEPSTWPAGWKVTARRRSSTVSPSLATCVAPGEIVAVARRHDLQRLGGGQHRAMPGARVVAVTVGDQRARHRPRRVDMEIARRTIEAGRRRGEQGSPGASATR